MKKCKRRKPTIIGRCCSFTSYYCPGEIFGLAFELSKYRKRLEETKKTIDRLSNGKRVSLSEQVHVYMNMEFVAYDMLHSGFTFGYIMGQLYNVKDREHLPTLMKFFKDHQVAQDRREADKKELPYIGKATKNLEKRKAA